LIFSSKPENADAVPKQEPFHLLFSLFSLVFSGLLVTRSSTFVFLLVHVFLHCGLGFWSSLWFAISFCSVKVSSFTWFSLKGSVFYGLNVGVL